MNTYRVTKGKIAISNDPGRSITADSLGACLAVCASDPVKCVSGIAVIVAPRPFPGDTGDKRYPAFDAVNGLRYFFNALFENGAQKKNLRIWLIGSARFLAEPRELSMGVQIYAAVTKILKKNRLKPFGEHVGGHVSRSVRLETGSDHVIVSLIEGREITI